MDLTLAGHQHCYDRVHPNLNGTVLSRPDAAVLAQHGRVQYTAPRAPVHVVQGTAGALQEEGWVWPPPAWSAARLANGADNVTGAGGIAHYLSTYGFGRLHAANRTHLRYSFEPVRAPPGGGSDGGEEQRWLRDDFWITKE